MFLLPTKSRMSGCNVCLYLKYRKICGDFGLADQIEVFFSVSRGVACFVCTFPSSQDIDTFMKGMEAGKRGHTFAKVDESLEKLMPAGARGVKQNK